MRDAGVFYSEVTANKQSKDLFLSKNQNSENLIQNPTDVSNYTYNWN